MVNWDKLWKCKNGERSKISANSFTKIVDFRSTRRIPPAVAVRMRKFLPLQEPVTLQDLFNSARSRAQKKINISYLAAGRSVWWKTVKMLPEAEKSWQRTSNSDSSRQKKDVLKNRLFSNSFMLVVFICFCGVKFRAKFEVLLQKQFLSVVACLQN